MGSCCYILGTLMEFMAVTAMLNLLLILGFESLPCYWESFHRLRVIVKAVFIFCLLPLHFFGFLLICSDCVFGNILDVFHEFLSAFCMQKGQGRLGCGVTVLAMASTSCASKSPLLMKDTSSLYLPYPAPLAKHEEVVANPKLFMATLEKLHASMGTKFIRNALMWCYGGVDVDQ
ncbi:high mobility group B protein 15 [Prunus yedoensis var. nudiflora]|uniref:High mobility group B protein 15 n=1 Tax=Prunus yedoensis var. nudiflora TaxID=2094558 RepID=A0A314Z1L9_PRUYE|nr:high mobility group B protein 15 [Prunus yedoensis var. nudiflora]